MLNKVLFSALLFGTCYVSSQKIYASCTTSLGQISLGSVNSFLIRNTPQTAVGSTGFACTGGAVTIIGTNEVKATILSTLNASGNSPRLKNTISQDYISYGLCKDATCNTVYNIGSIITWNSTTLLGLLGLFSGPGGTLSLYVKTNVGANIPAGTYTDTINLQWDWSLCTLGILNLCLTDAGTTTSTLNITLNVSNTCAIDSAPNINFGSAAFPISFNAINSSIQTRCTKNATYNVKLSSSQGEVNNFRRMLGTINGVNHYLQYQINRSGTVWTELNTLNLTGNGESQTTPYEAKINSNQINVPEGNYSDTVNVVVTY